MILFKACPRCDGDMMEEELLGETEIVCLQCGHRTYREALRKQPAAQRSLAKKAAETDVIRLRPLLSGSSPGWADANEALERPAKRPFRLLIQVPPDSSETREARDPMGIA